MVTSPVGAPIRSPAMSDTEPSSGSLDPDLCVRAVWATDLSFTIADALDPEVPLVFVNPAFERTTGYRSDEVLGRNCRFLQGEGTDRDAVQQLRDATRDAVPITLRLLNYRADGTAFWNEVSLSPVIDDAGRCTHVVGIQVDVTEKVDADRQRDEAYATAARALASEREARAEAEQVQQRLALMAETTSLLTSTLDVQESLRRLIVPLLADWCAITLVDDLGRIATSATRHRGGNEELLDRYAELQRTTLTDASPLRIVLATGRPQVRSPLTPGAAQAHTTSTEIVRIAAELGLHAALYVPLVARRRVLGVITLVSGDSQRTFDDADVQLVSDLARRAALALDNARMYGAEHETALALQRSLLPKMPSIEGLDLAAL
jgi:PAS domain S-box-containing protein